MLNSEEIGRIRQKFEDLIGLSNEVASLVAVSITDPLLRIQDLQMFSQGAHLTASPLQDIITVVGAKMQEESVRKFIDIYSKENEDYNYDK